MQRYLTIVESNNDTKAKIQDAPCRILKFISLLICVSFIVSCSIPIKKSPHKKLPTPPQQPPATTGADVEKKGTGANIRPSTADKLTPQRQASMRLVTQGNTAMESGDANKAATFYRDAINVDSSNGVAYYYLANAKSTLDEDDVAMGLLDKADALLGADTEWQIKIESLRVQIRQSPVGRTPPVMVNDPNQGLIPPPVDRSF